MKRQGATLHVNLSDDEHQALAARAKAAGLSQSEYARRILTAEHVSLETLMGLFIYGGLVIGAALRGISTKPKPEVKHAKT